MCPLTQEPHFKDYPTDILRHVHKNLFNDIHSSAARTIAEDWKQSKGPSVGGGLAKSVWVHSHNGMQDSC